MLWPRERDSGGDVCVYANWHIVMSAGRTTGSNIQDVRETGGGGDVCTGAKDKTGRKGRKNPERERTKDLISREESRAVAQQHF